MRKKGKFHPVESPREELKGNLSRRWRWWTSREEEVCSLRGSREALQRIIAEKKQSLLFLNRRGFANFILCPDCGLTFKCPNCSVTLTHHLRGSLSPMSLLRLPESLAPGELSPMWSHRLRGWGSDRTPGTGDPKLYSPGAGEQDGSRYDPPEDVPTNRYLKSLESGQIDILSRNADDRQRPRLSECDLCRRRLRRHLPPFSGFSLKRKDVPTSHPGRRKSGKRRNLGRSIIQTFNPDHYSILRAKDHDFVGFYQEEIGFRKALDYPPFTRLINFRLAGNSEKKTQVTAEALGRLGDALLKRDYRKGIEILGPSVAPFPKMRGRYRFHMLAKGKNSRWLHQFARNVILQSEDLTKGKGVTLEVDVDPVFIL